MKEQNKDYCTLFPDKLFGYDISQCCKAHDEAYVGTTPKTQADLELFNCIKYKGDSIALTIALVVFSGVSVFGWFFYKRKNNGDYKI